MNWRRAKAADVYPTATGINRRRLDGSARLDTDGMRNREGLSGVPGVMNAQIHGERVLGEQMPGHEPGCSGPEN
jgi:hypothetical protein